MLFLKFSSDILCTQYKYLYFLSKSHKIFTILQTLEYLTGYKKEIYTFFIILFVKTSKHHRKSLINVVFITNVTALHLYNENKNNTFSHRKKFYGYKHCVLWFVINIYINRLNMRVYFHKFLLRICQYITVRFQGRVNKSSKVNPLYTLTCCKIISGLQN